MDQLNSEDDRVVSNSITLLSKFLDRYEGKRSFKQDQKPAMGGYNSTQVNVVLRPELVKKVVQASYSQTVGQLRLKIAEAYGFQPNEFILAIKQQMVDPDEEDDKLLREFGLIQNFIIIQRDPNYNPDVHPKKMIAQKQENYDKLFSLLTKDNKPHLIEGTWELL